MRAAAHVWQQCCVECWVATVTPVRSPCSAFKNGMRRSHKECCVGCLVATVTSSASTHRIVIQPLHAFSASRVLAFGVMHCFRGSQVAPACPFLPAQQNACGWGVTNKTAMTRVRLCTGQRMWPVVGVRCLHIVPRFTTTGQEGVRCAKQAAAWASYFCLWDSHTPSASLASVLAVRRFCY